MANARDPAADRAGPVLRFCARAGCVSIGAVYALIGTWAQLALLRLARPAADEERILQRLREFPAGTALVIAICLGVFGYMAWRLYEAARDPYGLDAGPAGLIDRSTTVVGAFTYGLIAVSALKVLAGRGGHGEQSQRDLVARVFQWHDGRWLVGAFGVVIVLVGFYQFVYIAAGNHRIRIRMDRLAAPVRPCVDALAWAGFAARGVILWVLGGCLAKAAWASDPSKVRDTDSAFDFLGSLNHKAFAAVAIGTIAYGAFLWINAAFYRFGRDSANA
ncbi:MAG: DUF1206 domain-containing protein [Fibrobacteres bacterium]|nr:DUF1206 domain-containing protein [Fibrobacterota bacterium]